MRAKLLLLFLSLAVPVTLFAQTTTGDINGTVGARIRMHLTLQVGTVQEVVEVVGGAVLLEARSANLGQ